MCDEYYIMVRVFAMWFVVNQIYDIWLWIVKMGVVILNIPGAGIIIGPAVITIRLKIHSIKETFNIN